jgi:hypothetical protein
MSFYEPELKKSLSILEQKPKFPFLVREKINRLAEELFGGTEQGIRRIAHEIKQGVRRNRMVYGSLNHEDEHFWGFTISNIFLNGVREGVRDLFFALDSDRDTEEEVELAIRFFPRELTRQTSSWNTREYPIISMQHNAGDIGRLRNTKTIPFVPLLARLGNEIGEMCEEERGGLVANHSTNGLLRLMLSSSPGAGPEHNQVVDDCCLGVLKRLREMNIFRKHDIQKYQLVHCLCKQPVFARMRFQYLCDWDPMSLVRANHYAGQPLNVAAIFSTLESFRIVFETGIRKLSIEKGICMLFRKSSLRKTIGFENCTPFQNACKRFGVEDVVRVVQHTIADYWDNEYDTKRTLIVACTDRTIHLDAVYFLLHMNPNVLDRYK